jgi:peptidyl-prolyl cis-trans isomerase B (cyclophilin B)
VREARAHYDLAPMSRPTPILPTAIAVLAVTIAGCGSNKQFFAKKPAAAPTTVALTASTTPAATATATVGTPATAPSTTPTAGCSTVSAPAPQPGLTHETAATAPLDPKKAWSVILDTNCGLISIALDAKVEPKTTAAFAGLVQRGFFNGLTFHRIVPGFVIQGGDPLGTGLGGPGYTVVEPPPANTDYKLGVVAMAKTSTDPSGASGSQFFIVSGADAQLPAQYAVLGHVTAGMAAVARISALPTNAAEMPLSAVVIRRATLASQ